MKPRLRLTTHFEALEPRQLRSVANPTPDDGNDYHLALADNDEVVVSTSPQKNARVSAGSFEWYDGTAGSAIVGAGGTAFQPATCDGWYMWPWTANGGKDDTGNADEAGTRLLARTVADSGVKLVVIDNESWGFDIRYHSNQTVDSTITRMKQVLGWIRDERPQLKIGVYGYMSQSDDSKSVTWPEATKYASEGNAWFTEHLPEWSSAFAGWQATSEYLRPLSESVDYVFPALYTGTSNPDKWEESARITLEDSRRYGKPVIPFLWPLFHPGIGNGLGMTEIPTAFWERELDLVREYADSAYIWNGWGTQPGAAWLTATIAKTNVVSAQPSPLASMVATSTTPVTDEHRDDQTLAQTLLAA